MRIGETFPYKSANEGIVEATIVLIHTLDGQSIGIAQWTVLTDRIGTVRGCDSVTDAEIAAYRAAYAQEMSEERKGDAHVQG